MPQTHCGVDSQGCRRMARPLASAMASTGRDKTATNSRRHQSPSDISKTSPQARPSVPEEAARDTVFGGLAASGWYTAALTMKNEMRTLLAAAAFAVAGVTTAQAADIAPVTGHWTKLGADRSALVYYIDEPGGFHVVVTTQQGLTDRAAVVRFETVLAAGQSAVVSIPRGVGEEPARIVFSNAGDHLHIAKPNAAVSAR
jgi:hypothetical protein